MDGYGKSLLRELIPGLSSPYRVAIIIIATAWNIMGRLICCNGEVDES
jgi:hypothetical protein